MMSATMRCHQKLVNVKFQQFNSQSFMNVPLCIAPAHFYVHSGLLLECPPEPWSKRVVTATAPRVAVLSIPESVVGEPSLRIRRWVASGRFTVKVLPHKWRRAGSWANCTGTIAGMRYTFLQPSSICPNMTASILRPICDWQSSNISMVNGVLTTILVVVKCTWMEVGEPSSPPTHMLVAEVMSGEDDRVTSCWRRTSWTTHPLSWVQLVLCERGGAVDGGDSHVNVSHPHDSPHTALVSLHVAVHIVNWYPQLRACSIGDPVVARWGKRVAVKDWTTGSGRSVGKAPWTHCYWWVRTCSKFLLSHQFYNVSNPFQVQSCWRTWRAHSTVSSINSRCSGCTNRTTETIFPIPARWPRGTLRTTLTGTIANLGCVEGWAHFVAFPCCQREQGEGD